MKLHIILALALSLLVIGCDSNNTDQPQDKKVTTITYNEPDPELVKMLKDRYGVRLTGLEESAEYLVDEYGDAYSTAEFSIEIDDMDKKEMYMEETVLSAKEGGGVVLYIEDVKSGNFRYFDYNVTDNYIQFSQETSSGKNGALKERGAAVQNNENGTYTVWLFDDAKGTREQEKVVSNGYEALKLVEQYNDFSTIEPHVMMAAVAFGHTDIPDFRGPISCDDTASRPPICSIFKEFCECAACAVLDRAGNCELCPEL